MYYSPSQFAEMLKIPASTVRAWSKKFKNHLTPQGGRKHRVYTDNDLIVFQKIKELSAQNLTLDAIDKQLDLIVSPIEEKTESAETALSLIPEVAARIEDARKLASYANSRTNQIFQEMEVLRKQLNEQTEQNKQILELLQWAALPWWKKIFTRPPK